MDSRIANAESKVAALDESLNSVLQSAIHANPENNGSYANDAKYSELADTFSVKYLKLQERAESSEQIIEELSKERDNLKKELDNLIIAKDAIKGQIKENIIKSSVSSDEEKSKTSSKSSKIQISNLLCHITDIEWNASGCSESQIEGFVVGKSQRQPFKFNLQSQNPHEVQDELWNMMEEDKEFAELLNF